MVPQGTFKNIKDFEHENVVKGGPGWPLREIVCKYSGSSSRENESLNMKML